jgi:hypothetical protein
LFVAELNSSGLTIALAGRLFSDVSVLDLGGINGEEPSPQWQRPLDIGEAV